MSASHSNKQIAAIDVFFNAFGNPRNNLVSRLDCASSFFYQSSANHVEVGKEVANFITKIKAKDPRFAKFFIRTVDVLRTSSSVCHVDALIEVLIRCRLAHVHYGKSSRERPESRNGIVKSPFFNRRSASRGKLPRIDRCAEQSSSSDIHTDSLQTKTSYGNKCSQSVQCTSTSAGNPLFSAETSLSPCNRHDVATNTKFVRVVHREEPLLYKHPLHSRRGTTPSVPEETLCLQLCGALQGLEGSYFRKDAHGYMRILDSCSLSESQRSVVESVLSVAHLYADVVRIPPDHNNDFIVQAFLLSSQEILEEYIHDMGDILSCCRPLSLLHMLSMVESWRDRLTILHRLYNLRNETGTSLLELLYFIYSSVRRNFVVDKLLECCAGVLCRFIIRWMSGFEVKECDFKMIASCPHDGYRLNWIPPFFPLWVAQYILKTGKSWKFVDLQKSTENFDKARAIVATQLTPMSLYVHDERHKLERIVREVCQLVCGSVVHNFVFDHQLLCHLDLARSFLLLHDSRFSQALYQQFCERTYGLRSKLSKREADDALMAAVTLSNAARRVNFKINMDTLSSVNDSPNTSSRLQFVRSLLPVYRPKEPVREIFRGTEKMYVSLFHFVWPVEMSLLMISEKINEVKQNTMNTTMSGEGSNVGLRLVSSLLSVCERTLLGMRIYITVVVDQWFDRLRCWIDDAIDLDAVKNAHKNYLKGLTSSFFMDSDMEDIYGFIMSLLQISHDLSRLCLEISAEMETVQRDMENNCDYKDPLSARITQLLVVKAKLQKILPAFYSRLLDLSKLHADSAYSVLIGVI